MRTREVVFIAAVLLPLRSAAQQVIPPTGETIEVSIVNIDVFVTDKSGAHVRGLTKDDFEIFENGGRQIITNFAEYSDVQPPADVASPVTATQSLASNPTSQRRVIVVFVDRFHLPGVQSDPFYAALKDLLRKAVRPGDAAMVVASFHGSMQMRQSFTDDVAALDLCLDRFAAETSGAVVVDAQQARAEAEEALKFQLEAGAMSGNAQGDPAWLGNMAGLARAKAARFEERLMIENLKALVRAISGEEGKKLLVLATHRLSRVSGAEFLYSVGISVTESSKYRSELDAEADLKALYTAANANGVTIYPMFPEGLLSPSHDASLSEADRLKSDTGNSITPGETPDAVQALIASNETAALNEIAEHTGGISASGPDSAKLPTRINDDLNSYYSIAYRAKSGAGDRPREIVVKARNRDLVVRSRRQYVAKSETTRMEDRVISALFLPHAVPPFAVTVSFGPARPHGRQRSIPVTVKIPIGALTILPGAGAFTGAFSVYVAWGTKLQRVSETFHDTKSFRIPAEDVPKARNSHYSYAFDLLADPNTDRIAFGVVDEMSKIYTLKVVSVPQ